MSSENEALAEIAAKLNGTQQEPTEAVEQETEEVGVIEGEPEEIEGEEAPAEEGEAAPDTMAVKDFAEAVGWEASELYDTLMIPMGDNQEAVSLGDIKDKYQALLKTNSDNEIKIAKQAEQPAPVNMSQEMLTAQTAMAQVQQDYQNTDWTAFEAADPGGAALARQKLQERQGLAQQQIQSVQYQAQQSQQQDMQARAGQLRELIPEWNDEALRSTEMAAIKVGLIDAGYSEQLASNPQDPIGIKLMRELISLRAKVAGANDAVAKVKRAPKVLRNKGGQFQTSKQGRTAELVSVAKKSPTKGSELAAAKALLGFK